MEFLHPAMWHVALGSGIRQVAAPSNVTRRSGITTLNSPGGSTSKCDKWLWDDMPLNSPKSPAILEFYIRFWFWPYHRSRHVILHQSAKFYLNRTSLGRKMTSCRFSRWRISAILDFRGPIMGSLKTELNWTELYLHITNVHAYCKILSNIKTAE